jgi:DNA-binding MarR family transcriptional regulator
MQITPDLCTFAENAYPEQKRSPAHRTAEEILSHPQFVAARTAYIEGLFGLYENNQFMNRLLIEATRSLVFFSTLVICADYDGNDRATWPTIGLLKQMLEPYGLSTARRIDGLISQFVDAGYLTLSTTAADRRVRILTPTEKMIAHDLDWLAVHYRPLRILFPETGYDPPMRRDPIFQKALRKICRGFQAYAAQLMAANPSVMFFMERDAGTMILLKMISRGQAEGATRVSFSDLADRFGVSRTHVRKTIQEAEKRSLLQCSEDAIALAPGLVAAYDRFVADTMSGHDLMFRMATSQEYARPS